MDIIYPYIIRILYEKEQNERNSVQTICLGIWLNGFRWVLDKSFIPIQFVTLVWSLFLKLIFYILKFKYFSVGFFKKYAKKYASNYHNMHEISDKNYEIYRNFVLKIWKNDRNIQ